jgi:hypothetical protein
MPPRIACVALVENRALLSNASFSFLGGGQFLSSSVCLTDTMSLCDLRLL